MTDRKPIIGYDKIADEPVTCPELIIGTDRDGQPIKVLVVEEAFNHYWLNARDHLRRFESAQSGHGKSPA